MSDPTDLGAFLDQAWQKLGRGVADRRAPAWHPTLATVSPKGQPEARTVVLRGADRATGRLELHTDLHSAKVAALNHTPLAQLHVWDARALLQLRLSVHVTVLHGQETRARWDRVPDLSRPAYGTAPPPGTPIDSAFAYAKPGDFNSFAVLLCDLAHIDLVHLGERHRRAGFSREDDWRGQWLSP